jgi:hypothetical protein
MFHACLRVAASAKAGKGRKNNPDSYRDAKNAKEDDKKAVVRYRAQV